MPRLQSAMEYLMTYGWAILIIAVVLIGLFSLGVFGGSALLGSTCTSNPQFLCTNPSLSQAVPSGSFPGTIAVLTFTVGQATGEPMYNAIVLVVPQSDTPPLNANGISVFEADDVAGQAPITVFPSGATNAVEVDVGLNTLPNNAVGSPYTGDVYIYYNSTSSSGPATIIADAGKIITSVTP